MDPRRPVSSRAGEEAEQGAARDHLPHRAGGRGDAPEEDKIPRHSAGTRRKEKAELTREGR
eukprot:756141-Hanusia_phi.AAC.2